MQLELFNSSLNQVNSKLTRASNDISKLYSTVTKVKVYSIVANVKQYQFKIIGALKSCEHCFSSTGTNTFLKGQSMLLKLCYLVYSWKITTHPLTR